MTKQEFIAVIKSWYNGTPVPFEIGEGKIDDHPCLRIAIETSKPLSDYLYFFDDEIEALDLNTATTVAYVIDHVYESRVLLNRRYNTDKIV